jgi:glycosyltransferase involved in cell wall biosynthesis
LASFLAVNWRDLKNPDAGGAEVHLHEILKRVVANGHDVTLFVSNFEGGAESDSHDGIKIIRKGTWYNANFILPLHIKSFLKQNRVDLIIEDVNKIPFFMPLHTKTRVFPVIPHLFGSTVFRETNILFATYVYSWEWFIPLVYRRCRFAVISPSTKEDMEHRGIASDRVEVVLCGLDHSTYRLLDAVERANDPTIVHFGRIRKYKSIEIVIDAFQLIARELPNAKLLIIGEGPEKPNLMSYAARSDVGDSVQFLGAVGIDELIRILNEAHLFLNASSKEGWGLTVVEANACGVPVVASNRPGLKDSVLDGKTGFLVEYKDRQAMAAKAVRLLTDDALWNQMSAAALEWARTLTWDRTAEEMERLFLEEIAESSIKRQ